MIALDKWFVLASFLPSINASNTGLTNANEPKSWGPMWMTESLISLMSFSWFLTKLLPCFFRSPLKESTPKPLLTSALATTSQMGIMKRSRSWTRKRNKRSWWSSRTNISTSPSRWSRTSHGRGISSWLTLIVDQAGTVRRQRKCASNGIFTENVSTTATGKRVTYQRRISLLQKWRRHLHSWLNAAVNRGSGWDLAVSDHPKNHLTSTLNFSSYHSVKIHDQIMLASRGNPLHAQLSNHTNFYWLRSSKHVHHHLVPHQHLE
jgi:hypothetical protein